MKKRSGLGHFKITLVEMPINKIHLDFESSAYKSDSRLWDQCDQIFEIKRNPKFSKVTHQIATAVLT